jgi:hypothetical protein
VDEARLRRYGPERDSVGDVGLHMLSAELEREQGANTLSWWMAEWAEGERVGVSYIELDRLPGPEELVGVEERCNEDGRASLPVTVLGLEVGDPALEEGHTRGLPADHKGPVGLITVRRQ